MNIKVTSRQHATIIAALRFWQRVAMHNGYLPMMGGGIAEPEIDIATNGGKHGPMTAIEIDDMIEGIN